MKYFLLTWIGTAVALIITAQIVPGIAVTGLGAAAIAALVLGLVNAIVRPILVILTLPITVVTLGLFLLVVNAISLWVVAALSPGFAVTGFLSALIGSIILSITASLINRLILPEATH
ncbi:MAG: phage holin family protein [Desertifilum sp. SIO1I2]|nr:phage holin family protein [Desertifilum sp. SIO1I2]